ncbi:MAG: type I-F CRISPR-associated endoribonuclease Cas6/Csy4 [Anaerolineae bacterium]|nr:type I-F CRISPR-associated endoribonuclease Cas6/Csy4 [Anaerolineae bacterium]
MTSHYIDIMVVPDPETSAAQLLSALYGRLHLALVERGAGDIGVSFPRYSIAPRSLGDMVRIHGSEAALRALMGNDWLKGVRDHVRFSELGSAPADASHRVVRRRQFKTNVERLRRRRMKRKNETEAQAASAIPATIERRPDLPFVHIRSHSTGKPFCLFISLGPLHDTPVPGEFNTYGLGGTATVPWF